MSSTTLRVVIEGKGIVTGTDQVEKSFDKIRQSAVATQQAVNKAVKFDVTASIPGLKNLESSLGGVGKAFSTLKTLSVGGLVGAAFIRGIDSAIDKSVEFENALRGVESVARSFGADSDQVKAAIIDFTKDGLINATDAALAFKQVLSTGTELPLAIKLLNSLKDTAANNRQAFYTLGQAVVATTEGIKNGNSVRADAVGVTKNLSVLEKEYAASLGRTADSLSETEKIQGRVVGFIREGSFAAGDAAKLNDTYTGSVARLSTSYDRLLAKIGSFITNNRLVIGSIDLLSGAIDRLSYTSNTADQKLKILLADLAAFDSKRGLSFTANEDKERLIQEIESLQKIVALEKLRGAQGEFEAKIVRDRITAEKELENQRAIAAKAEAKRQKEIVALTKKYQDAGLDPIKKLEAQRDRELKLYGDNARLKILIEKNFYDEKAKFETKDFNQKLTNARKLAAVQQKINDALTTAASDPYSTAKVPADVKAMGKEDEFKQRQKIGQGVGLASNVVGGADGARALVSGGAAAGLNLVIPGLGTAAKPILDALTQGPDAVREMVKEFAKALPDVIEAFITAIPVIIEELANQTPVIIERLAEKAPDIITKLIEALPRVIFAIVSAIPKIIVKFIEELIKNIPRIVSELARAVYNAISKILGQLTGGLAGGKGGGSFLSKPLKAIGISLATGGEVRRAKGGVAFKDSIPANLMDGELTVDRTTTSQLKKFLAGGNGDSRLSSDVRELIALLSRPQEITSDFKLDNATFAKAILTVNRTGQRTT